MWPYDRLLGTALTVRLAPGDNFGAVVAPLLAQPGDVMVIDTGHGDTAVVGGLIARVSQERSVVGCVVDGAVRDVAELERLRFPVTARAVTPRRSTKVEPAEIGGPIRCGGVLVHAGDIVLADRDGVAFVAATGAETAREAIHDAQRVEREADDIAVLTARFESVLRSATVKRLSRPG